mmetsp:Transcript_6904/g.12578  ORF Transcript_6904/g.12578 Transcript_6904/m.12578 type:complete len:96 (+) Transcript_6904:315-602(+)
MCCITLDCKVRGIFRMSMNAFASRSCFLSSDWDLLISSTTTTILESITAQRKKLPIIMQSMYILSIQKPGSTPIPTPVSSPAELWSAMRYRVAAS